MDSRGKERGEVIPLALGTEYMRRADQEDEKEQQTQRDMKRNMQNREDEKICMERLGRQEYFFGAISSIC